MTIILFPIFFIKFQSEFRSQIKILFNYLKMFKTCLFPFQNLQHKTPKILKKVHQIKMSKILSSLQEKKLFVFWEKKLSPFDTRQKWDGY